ncbi:unnamed protein product [Owenia fusiformis]|uniref:C2H2-type domain-containing protein n=1 Tax=Owenia fusiformis TaxID=6347 RepID=A0A8S4NA04_OWEFU|nr:unnamed protein product [Owenia fusiformis]
MESCPSAYHPSTHPPTHPSTHPPIHPSTHPPTHLPKVLIRLVLDYFIMVSSAPTLETSYNDRSKLETYQDTSTLETSYMQEQGYNCQLCCKTFSLKSSLDRHKLIHTRVSLFKCPVCNKEPNPFDDMTEDCHVLKMILKFMFRQILGVQQDRHYSHFGNTRTYQPKTRPVRPLSKPQLIRVGAPIPEGHTRLVNDAEVVVKQSWLVSVLASAIPKQKHYNSMSEYPSKVIKALIDGMYEPHELYKEGGVNFYERHQDFAPVIHALRAYTALYLKQPSTVFTKAWNEKVRANRQIMSKFSNPAKSPKTPLYNGNDITDDIIWPFNDIINDIIWPF